ncbi:MAG: secondary thiamine-phosphate synthase enzyme YjbQ [Patescibacteria group bacterium]
MQKTSFTTSTEKRYQLVDITSQVEAFVRENNEEKGTCLIFTPHSTAAILLTENEKGLKNDWLKILKDIVSGYDFEHNKIDNNADSHILSGLLGQEKTIPIQEGRLAKGTWQQIFLVELDGPRKREITITV